MAQILATKDVFILRNCTTLKKILTTVAVRSSSTMQKPLPDTTVKSYDEIPRVPFHKTVGPILTGKLKRQDLPQFISDRLEEYGPIYREKFPTQDEFVFTSNPIDWEVVFKETRFEETSSSAEFLWHMAAYAEKKSIPYSYTHLTGEEFYHRRDLMGKSLLHPAKIKEYVPNYSVITEDLLLLLEDEMEANGNTTITDIRTYIDRWQFECGGMVTFQKRLGFLNKDQENWNRSALKIFNSSKIFFETFPALIFASPHHRLMKSKLWKDFEKSMDNMFEGADELLNDDNPLRFTENKKGVSKGIELNILVDVMRGSTDTVSHAVLWSLIELGKNPEVQDRVYEEISPILKQNSTLSYNALQKQSYLRGVVKEIFRLNPLVPLITRKIHEDVVLDSGYEVPAGTTIAMTMSAYKSDEYFENGEKMKPERWIHAKQKCPMTGSSPPPKFAVLPFGHGPRSCIGKRTAENLMLVFLAKFLHKYKVISTNGWVKGYSLFVHPEGPVNVELVKRN